MPILSNLETGAAEQLSKQQADAALAQGTHGIPMTTPEGQDVVVPKADAEASLAQGYTQLTHDALDQALKRAKYDTIPEELKTFAEGAAQDATFGAATGIERAFGVDPEAIRARREVNPVAHGLGRAAGFGASMATGLGEGKIAAEAGALAAAKLGVGGAKAGFISKRAADAVKAATEFALIQGGDEVSKGFAQDPSQSLGTAISNVGLAALWGGGLGAGAGAVGAGASKLWGATAGRKLEQLLTALKGKAESVANQAEGGIAPVLGREAVATQRAGIDPFTREPVSPPRMPQEAPVAAPQGPRIDPFTKQPLEAVESKLGPIAEPAAPVAPKIPDPVVSRLDKAIANSGSAAVGTLVDLVSSAGGPAGFIMQRAARYLGRQASEATKTAVLKFLGTDAAVNPQAFETMHRTLEALYKGARLTGSAMKALSSEGATQVLPEHKLPTEKQRQVLDKYIRSSSTNPEQILNTPGQLAHYLPEYAGAVGEMSTRAVAYLHTLLPEPTLSGPLDMESPPSQVQVAKYNRALDIAQQPLVTLQAVKDGSITPQDLTTLKTIYPELYSGLQQKMFNSVAEAASKGTRIPYKTQLGMSLFMGMPLNSSTMPQNIMSNQQALATIGQSRQAQQASQGQATASQGQGLKKLAKSDATPQQARASSYQRA